MNRADRSARKRVSADTWVEGRSAQGVGGSGARALSAHGWGRRVHCGGLTAHRQAAGGKLGRRLQCASEGVRDAHTWVGLCVFKLKSHLPPTPVARPLLRISHPQFFRVGK